MMASNPQHNTVFGYVQSVSPVKKSRTSRKYFNFEVQTGENQWHRAVCFDDKLQPTINALSESATAVQISNVRKTPRKDDPDELDLFVNDRSKVAKASIKDVPFNFQQGNPIEVLLVEIQHVQNIEQGQMVEVKGRLKIHEPANIQQIKIGKEDVPCLERAVITDHTGSISFTIWGHLIEVFRNSSGSCLHLKNVRVKQFKGEKRLATTNDTTMEIIDADFPEPDQEELQRHLGVNQIHVREILMAENLRRYAACLRCLKFLTDDFTQNIVKCPTCGIVQRQEKCKTRYDIQLHISNEDDKPLKLTAFEDNITKMVNHYNQEKKPPLPVTLTTTDDVIYSAILSLTDLNISYNANTFVIEDIHFQE